MAKRKSRLVYTVLIPSLIVFFLFHTLPLLQGIFYSFTDFPGYGDWNFVGFENYIKGFQDSRIRYSYLFTIGFAILATILVNIVSLLIALGFNSKIKFKQTLKGIYFIPYMLGSLIVGYIFKFIFSELITAIGQSLDIHFLQQSILGNQRWAWLGVLIVSVWKSTAFNTILYLSGLVTIDADLYEAADIDGATGFQKFKNITFPLIMPFFTINVVVAMKNFLMVFDEIMSLTNGGPGTSTESISFLIFKNGFSEGQFSYQSANAVVFFLIILIISFFQMKVLEGDK